MILQSIYGKRKGISILLAGILLFETIHPTRVLAGGEGQPVAAQLKQYVAPFTGDFSYSIPLLYIPGPNGENIPVTAGYSAGIKTEQQASWIGLGWNYSPGEISRDVKGIPDDWNGKSVTSVRTTQNPLIGDITDVTSYYGPLYYKNYTSATGSSSMDIYQSERWTGTSLFNYPDYDSYYVSGPGIGGEMNPYLFNYATLLGKNTSQYSFKQENAFTKKAQFRFKNELPAKNYVPFYRSTVDLTYVYYPSHVSSLPGNNFEGDYDLASNTMKSANHIDYFTNDEINNSYATIKGKGFLDFQVPGGTRRPAPDYDPTEIGAFKITNPSGMTYHYSLPVYSKASEKVRSFFLNSDFTVNNGDALTTYTKSTKYENSWKLTAITGPDFADSNNNGIADEGDKGYWVAYNYGKWADAFPWTSPYYNYRYDVSNKKIPDAYNPPGFTRQDYKKEGTVSSGDQEVYYLNTIKTATHTAFFVKEIRLDGHSSRIAADNNKPVPSLRLSRIVLLRNQDAPLFTNSGTMTVDSRFSGLYIHPERIVHSGHYNANKASIDQKSLKTIEFAYDYKLCKKLYNNINSTYTTSNISYVNSYTNQVIYTACNKSSFTDNASDPGNSGKLTLNEIRTYENGYVNIYPSHLFEYDKTNTTKNPDYDPDKTDFWGYYKSDYDHSYRGAYTSNNSKNNVDAWSLRKITTPLGGEIIPEYESDSYQFIGYDGKGGGSPRRMFIFNQISRPASENTPPNNNPPVSSTSWTLSFGTDKEINEFYSDPNFQQLDAFIPYTPAANNCTCPGTPVHTASKAAVSSRTYNSTANTLVVSGLDISYYCTGCKITTPNGTTGWGFVNINLSTAYGGGLRVKSLQIKDPETSEQYKCSYAYEGGWATTEPDRFYLFQNRIEKSQWAEDRHALPAQVGYSKVTVQEMGIDNRTNGKTVYEFNNYAESYKPDRGFKSTFNTGQYHIYESFRVSENLSTYGTISSTTLYDVNDKTVERNTFEYDIQGRVEEIFYQGLTVPPANNYYGIYIKQQLFAALKKQNTYRDGLLSSVEVLARDPVSGQPTKTRTVDPTRGVMEKDITPAYQDNAEMGAKTVNPAYKNILSAGSKEKIYHGRLVYDVNGVASVTNLDLVSGIKNTWRKQQPYRVFNTSTAKYETGTSGDLWMLHKSFDFNGNTDDTQWREFSEATLVNARNMPLETKGIGKRFAAIKYGYDNRYKLAEIKDANHGSFAFSGFEDKINVGTTATPVNHFGGEVTKGDMQFLATASVKAHTGSYMARVPAGQYGPEFVMRTNNEGSGSSLVEKGLQRGRTYRASVWVHKDSHANATLVAHLNGSLSTNGSVVNTYVTVNKSNANNILVGDWYLMSVDVDVPADYVSSGGGQGNQFIVYLWNTGTTDAYFDDLNVHALDAEMTGYVYDEKTGWLTATIDNNNFATVFQYDAAGRITATWKETAAGLKLIRENVYRFARQ